MELIQWANTEKTAIYINAPRTITEQDVRIILQEIAVMHQSVDHPIDLIIDRRQTISVPRKTLTAMRKLVTGNQFQHLVFIGFTTLPRMLVETLTHLPGMFATEPIFVDTLDEACQQLGIPAPLISDASSKT